MVENFGHSFKVNFSRYSSDGITFIICIRVRVCTTVGDDHMDLFVVCAYGAEYRLPLCKTKHGVCMRQIFLQAQWMLPIAKKACDGDEMGLYMTGCNTVKYQFHNMPACLASWLCTSSDGRRSLAICFKSSCQFDRRSVDKDSSL